MYYVYILLNETNTRTYTGVADDVNKRLAEHNAGRVKSSRPYRPYKIIYTESFETFKEARQKERFYKSTTGRRRLKEMFLNEHFIPFSPGREGQKEGVFFSFCNPHSAIRN